MNTTDFHDEATATLRAHGIGEGSEGYGDFLTGAVVGHAMCAVVEMLSGGTQEEKLSVFGGLYMACAATWSAQQVLVDAGRVARAAASRATWTLDGEEVDIEEFFEANRDGLAEEDVAAIRALGQGQEFVFGGGAAPACVIRRVR